MLFDFNDYREYREIVLNLLEANVHTSRYKEGSLVVLKSDHISTFNNKGMSFTADAATVFVKVKLNPEASDENEIIGDEDPLVTLDVYSDVSQSTKIGTVTWAQNPDSYYNGLKLGDEMNWGGSTSTLETAQCIGVFYDGNDEWNTEDGRKKVEDKIIAVLGEPHDWHPKGKSNLISKMPNFSNEDFAILIDLIQGMHEFVKAKVSFTPHIIHGSIDSGYKRAEEKNTLVQVSGVKDNTSDMIICNSSAADLTTAIEKQGVASDDQGICKTEGGISFVQVSLKKSKDGAQLGKVTSALLLKHKISPALAIFRQVVDAEYHPDYVRLMTEGWMGDFVKSSFNKLKDIASGIAAAFNKVVEGAKNLVRGWVGDFKKVWAQETTSAISDFSRLFGVDSRDVKSLTEAFNSYIDTGQMFLAEETEESLNELLKSARTQDVNKFVDSITKRVSDLVILYDTQDYLHHVIGRPIVPAKVAKDFNMDISIKLLANEVSLRTLNKIFRTNSSNMDQLIKDMIDVQKEMLFGKTSLPLYKVYGRDSDSKTYEYLTTAAEFAAERQSQILGAGGDVSYPVSGFSVKDQKSKYYNIESWIITGVVNGASTYSQMRMGTNKAGAFSYVIEGTKTKSQAEYNKKFGIT